VNTFGFRQSKSAETLVLIQFEKPITRNYIRPNSKWFEALKNYDLHSHSLVDARKTKETLRTFFKDKFVEGLNTVSSDYIYE